MLKNLSLFALATTALAGKHPRDLYEAAFADHIAQYKVVIKDGEDFVARLQVFIDNYDMIEAHNADPKASFKMGLNKFSHLTLDEFHDEVNLGGYKERSLRMRMNKDRKVHTPSSASAAAVDWSTTPAVSPVKNQGNCGSCWTFSTTGGIEGAYYLSTNNGTSLSEQQIIDCDPDSNGCNGGNIDAGFTFAKLYTGLCTEAAYPYVSGNTGVNGTCQTSCSIVPGSAPASWVSVTTFSVPDLESAVEQQPVSIGVDAMNRGFQTYQSGIVTSDCGQHLDHAVLAVGYGTDNGIDYWKVKNSWGTDWGEAGYIRIEKSSANICGVLGDPSYPII